MGFEGRDHRVTHVGHEALGPLVLRVFGFPLQQVTPGRRGRDGARGRRKRSGAGRGWRGCLRGLGRFFRLRLCGGRNHRRPGGQREALRHVARPAFGGREARPYLSGHLFEVALRLGPLPFRLLLEGFDLALELAQPGVSAVARDHDHAFCGGAANRGSAAAQPRRADGQPPRGQDEYETVALEEVAPARGRSGQVEAGVGAAHLLDGRIEKDFHGPKLAAQAQGVGRIGGAGQDRKSREDQEEGRAHFHFSPRFCEASST